MAWSGSEESPSDEEAAEIIIDHKNDEPAQDKEQSVQKNSIEDYRTLISEIAAIRGYSIGFGQPEENAKMFENAKFMMSLRDKPAFLPNGATLFVAESTYAMVLEHEGKFIEFCAMFKCFDFASFVTSELALCHYPTQDPDPQYVIFAIMCFMKENGLEETEKGWEEMLSHVRSEGITKQFGKTEIKLHSKKSTKGEGIVHVCFTNKSYRTMCQFPFCGKLRTSSIVICGKH